MPSDLIQTMTEEIHLDISEEVVEDNLEEMPKY